MSDVHTSDLPERAVAAALEIVLESGADALTLRAVARRLGVTHRAIAKHTDGLPGLLARTAASVYHQIDRFIHTRTDCHPPRPGAFRAMGHAYIQFARAHPSWIRLLTRPVVTTSVHPALTDARRLFYDRMCVAVRDGQRRGVLRAGPVEPIATFAWTAVQGFALLEHEVQQVTDTTADARTEAFLDGVFLGIRALGDPGWWPASVGTHTDT